MGLDMRLYAERYFNVSQVRETFDVAEAAGLPHNALASDFAGVSVVAEAAYWRKAYLVHEKFSDLVPAGLANCETVEVSREFLMNLWDELSQIDSPEHAEEIEYTIQTIDRVLRCYDNSWRFTYTADW